MAKIKLLNKSQVGNATNGSSLKGKLMGITYKDLVNTFGEPTFLPEDSGDGKVNFEWVFDYKEDIFTVYDWKVEEDYAKYIMGRMDEIQFHVGGKTYAGDFVEYIQKKVMSKVGSY